MNKWTGMGRLVRDPDVDFTNTTGKCVTRFILAINYRSKGKDYAEFIPCECWEKVAETVGEYCGKGDKILVEGRLRTTKYEKDGDNRFFTRIVVKHVEFAEKKNKTKKAPESAQAPLPETPSGSVDEWPPINQDEIFSDEIPF